MTARPILETRGLTCRFGGVTAVDNVDFAIAEGELRCLIGPNGAGKSTLFRCMTRQQRPTKGEILLRGHSLAGYDPHQIARMGVAIKNQIPSVYGDSPSARIFGWPGDAPIAAGNWDKPSRPCLRKSGSAIPYALPVGWTSCPTHIGSGLSSACCWRPAQRSHCLMSLRRE